MTSLLQIGLSISVLCNCMSMWWISRMIISHDRSIDVILKIMIDICNQQMRDASPKVVPINIKKP